ncbi:MAG: acetate uptake transporter [Trebonia sp.]
MSVPAMANPAPWAVTAFGTTSFMLGMYQSGLLNSAGVPIVLPAAFFFGGLVQIIVAVLEFSRGNMFGGAVFGTYGPFWVILGAFETLYATSIPAARLSSATSLFLAVFAVVTFYLAIASLRTDLILAAIIWLIFVGLVLLSIGTLAPAAKDSPDRERFASPRASTGRADGPPSAAATL